MHQTITFTQFCDAFRDAGRNGSFTYEAKRCLFDYLEDYEEETGEAIELDVIALCCDYNEDNYEAIAENYRLDLSECENPIDTVREYLEYRTMVVGEPSEGVFVYACF